MHNRENVESHIIDKFKKCANGKYLARVDLELTLDEARVVRKVLITNSEKEMSEHLYDIKLFQIQKISDRDIIAYQLEIFSLNSFADPSTVYQYTYPMSFSGETQDPHSLVINVINLIEPPGS